MVFLVFVPNVNPLSYTRSINMAVSGHQDYWNVNVPEKDQTQECPLPLANVNAADRKQLAIPDAQFHVMSWEDVKDVISTDVSIPVCNDLDTK
jgi:hypothetical protein